MFTIRRCVINAVKHHHHHRQSILRVNPIFSINNTSPIRYFSQSTIHFHQEQQQQQPNSQKEEQIKEILINEFNPSRMRVEDVSGGCGAMFNVIVVSDMFNGLTAVKRHRLVQDALKAQIKEMHGISLFLKTEDEYQKMIADSDSSSSSN
jgi:stress-induced morphogen